jgi:ATP-dependent RNA helicase RhlE
VEVIAQIHPVDRDKKHPMLAHLIKTHQWKQVLVFTRTKHGANKLVEQLARDGITAMAIHGNKSQSARTKALAEFKDGKLTALIATDIAARGIDIDQLPHVVNYDLPNVPEDYVHRIGRTGRAGATGEAVSLVCVDERDLLHDIERFIKREIPVEVIAGFEPDPTAAAADPAAQRPGPSPERWRTWRPTQCTAQAGRQRQCHGNAPKPAGGNAGHGQAAKPPAAAAQCSGAAMPPWPGWTWQWRRQRWQCGQRQQCQPRPQTCQCQRPAAQCRPAAAQVAASVGPDPWWPARREVSPQPAPADQQRSSSITRKERRQV